MCAAEVVTTRGTIASIEESRIDELSSGLKGALLREGDAGYEESRTIWNAMIDRKPALIARCADVSDVVRALNFGREHSLLIAIRGAGHNIAGKGVCDGGLMIDLSGMRAVKVDEGSRRAQVEPGATLGDVDAATQAHGLALPLGINSTTGIAGLTLGGGFGWLTRQFGMTVDSLVSADVVLADGEQVRASESENADLFWAIRGGGGNFGIVTSFEFDLHAVGPEVFGGLFVYPNEEGGPVLRQYREFVETMPQEMTVFAVGRQAPPLPFLPEDVHGKAVVILGAFYNGDIAEGEKLAAPLGGFGKPYGTHAGANPYTGWQQLFDPLLAPGARNYWKSHNLAQLSDGFIDLFVESAGKLPSPHTELVLPFIGGAANRVAPDAMAYAHRDARWVMNVHGRWETAAEDDAAIAWCREFWKAAQPYASGGAFMNFLTEDETERVQAAYGANYGRLAEIKKKYDPDNLFRINQNISPKG